MTSVLMSVSKKVSENSLSSRCEMCVSNWKQIFWPKKIHSVQGFVKPQLRILPFNSRWSFGNFEVGSERLSWRVLKKGDEIWKKLFFTRCFFSSSFGFSHWRILSATLSCSMYSNCSIHFTHLSRDEFVQSLPHHRGG